MKSTPRLNYGSNHYIGRDAGNIDTRAQRIAEQEAEIASRALRDATRALFSQFAERHDIAEHEARLLLMDTGLREQRPCR